eukprot:3701952-Amphidinium_carterae.1
MAEPSHEMSGQQYISSRNSSNFRSLGGNRMASQLVLVLPRSWIPTRRIRSEDQNSSARRAPLRFRMANYLGHGQQGCL